MENILKPHEDPLVIEVDIGLNNKITKIMVNIGSSVDILYISANKRIGGKIEDLTPPMTSPIWLHL